jgi:hypothetical protein
LKSYSVFTILSVHIPAKITGSDRPPQHDVPVHFIAVITQQLHTAPALTAAAGDNPVVIQIEAAIDNANEDEDLPLAP